MFAEEKKNMDKKQTAICIKCRKPLRDRGYTSDVDGLAAWSVGMCETETCERYGLITGKWDYAE